jgi:hypothetical protein
MKKPTRKPVLADHEKRGKKLVPPLIAGVGPFSYVPWINHIIPEIIWIALLNHSLGEAEGAAAALELARVSEEAATQSPIPLFVGMSDFCVLREDERAKVVSELLATERLVDLRCALSPLVQLYPSCPMQFLFSQQPNADAASAIATLKVVLGGLFDKERRESVMVQGTAVYIAFVLGRLKVKAGLTLSHFPEIEKYPTTELSQRVASAARATMFNFFAASVKTASWPVEFWNQGQQIEPCTFLTEKTYE